MARKSWVPIVIGIVIFVVVVGVGVVGGLIWVVTRQASVETVSGAGGEQEFEKLRAPFAGQQALIELPDEGDEGTPVVHREMSKRNPGKVTSIHLRVWVPRERKLVRLDLPFWMMRLAGNKPIQLHSDEGGFRGVTLRVTPEEIERRGPGLILDHGTRNGERVLVWTD